MLHAQYFFASVKSKALLNLAQIMVQKHPDSEKIIALLENAAQHSLAELEQLPDAADVIIEGHQHVVDSLRKAAEAAPGNS